MMQAGNSVHLEKNNCFIRNQRTGRKIPIHEKNGTFEISIWVPKVAKVQKSARVVDQIKTSNRYETLQDEEEDEDQAPGFSRQDAEF